MNVRQPRPFTAVLLGILLAAAISIGTSAGPPIQYTTTATTPPTMYMSGSVRCTAGVWSVLSDTAHSPYGITGVTSSSTWVRVAHDPIVHVGSVQVTADETYVQDDVTVGASVGLTYTELRFAQHGVAVNPANICTAYSNVWVTGWAEP
jgi:hypothetical protein